MLVLLFNMPESMAYTSKGGAVVHIIVVSLKQEDAPALTEQLVRPVILTAVAREVKKLTGVSVELRATIE